MKTINNPYETDIFEKLSGGCMRPGGTRLTDKIAHKYQFNKDKKILDIGCGTGVTLEYLEKEFGIEGTGVDISKINIKKGKKRNAHLNILTGDGSQLEFASQTFDVVLMECSLSVIGHKEDSIHEAFRVLKPGGKLIITDLYIKEPGSNEAHQFESNLIEKMQREHGKLIQQLPCCINGAFIKEKLFSKIKDSGFKISTWEDETEELKDLILKIIIEYGSMENYYSHIYSDTDDSVKISRNLKKMKLGYLLIVAEKILA